MEKTELRSQRVLKRPEWSTCRSLVKAMGYSDYDLELPRIGIANSWSTCSPGHSNLNQISEFVKKGIYQGGGTPVEFGVIGVCDGMGNGNVGMRYCLPARDLIANEVETMTRINNIDGLVILGSCDKVVPGLLMAAARLDIPTIFVNGGPMLGGEVEFDGRVSDNGTMLEALGMLQNGEISEEEYYYLEDVVCPGPGSCSFMGTANTMCAIAEALGMCIPGSSMIPAVMSARLQAASASGRLIVKMVHEGLTARKLINPDGIENAIRLGMAIGGSTNMTLHIPAIAYEAGYEMTPDEMDRISRNTPHLARIHPAGPLNVIDFYRAGGVPAVMKQLLPLIHKNALTCTGKTWEEELEKVKAVENEVVHSIENAWHPWGSIGIVKGNLAPNGGVTKPISIDPEMLTFTGTAICFNSEEETEAALAAHAIKPGMVIVVRYEGPKGCPGMRELVRVMKVVYGQGLSKSVAVITDGRFSGTNNGCFVGHISPEAAENGPLAAVCDGDRITIDIPNGTLTLHVDEAEIKRRIEKAVKPVRQIDPGYLNVYARIAESADKGAIIRNR